MKKTWIIQVFFLYLRVISDEHLTPNVMSTIDKERIKNIIESYCEGITYLEFSADKLDEMVDEIVKGVESNVRSNAAWEAEFRGETNSFRGDMENW